MIESICRWLREGGETEAAELLAQCQIDTHFVDICFEISGDRSYELFDVSVAAPRKVHIAVEERSELATQIETAIKGQGEADGVYVRDIRWIPLAISPTESKDRDLDGILTTFNADQVSRFWTKALARKATDPDGAITAARSMLESVCKHILDSRGVTFDAGSTLPNLFHATLDAVGLAPNAQTDRTLRQVMGNCQSIVTCLAALRNDIGDAHGKRSGDFIPEAIHAEFVVNLSATVAMLILGQAAPLETFTDFHQPTEEAQTV